MDPKRKRIYIIILVVSTVATLSVFVIDRFRGGGAAHVTPVLQSNPTNQASVASTVSGDAKTGFTAPPIFPANPNFDFSVLDSSSFKQLQLYNAVVNQAGELGRTDPFTKY